MPSKKSYTVGSEIEAMCGTCKDATVHVIEVIKNEEPYKVLCKSCHSSHRFRSPDAPVKAKKTTTTTRAKKSATGTASKSKTPEQRKWTRLCNKVDTENPNDYEMSKSFAENDAIQHKKFGLGVVVEIVNPTKISVAFEDGIRTLVQNR